MVDMTGLANTDGQTTEEKLQAAIAGDDVQLYFKMDGSDEVFFQAIYKQGITFEWIKNKVAENLEAQYGDLSLFYNGKRIPEPFCLIDMNVVSGSDIFVKIAEGAVVGHDALREQVLAEIAADDALNAAGDTGGDNGEERKD